MIIVYVDNTLIGVVRTDDEQEALEWLCSQVDLGYDIADFTFNEAEGTYAHPDVSIELMYEDWGARLDIN